jgi:hyperosmotically inducible protein
MSFKRNVCRLLVTGVLLGAWTLVSAQEPTGQTSSVPADNTKVNQRDKSAGEPTADQQTSNRSDLEITRQIRSSIAKDKSLSTYAHNVKIITQSGQVTLKGPVRSDDEKKSVEAKAAAVAGADKITNELAVQPKN